MVPHQANKGNITLGSPSVSAFTSNTGTQILHRPCKIKYYSDLYKTKRFVHYGRFRASCDWSVRPYHAVPSVVHHSAQLHTPGHVVTCRYTQAIRLSLQAALCLTNPFSRFTNGRGLMSKSFGTPNSTQGFMYRDVQFYSTFLMSPTSEKSWFVVRQGQGIFFSSKSAYPL
jgi:hypothetical protein